MSKPKSPLLLAVWSIPAVVILTPVVLILDFTSVPTADRVTSALGLVLTPRELSERALLVLWWALAIVFVVTSWLWGVKSTQQRLAVNARLVGTGALGSCAIVLLSLLVSTDDLNLWSGIPPFLLLVGLGCVITTALILRRNASRSGLVWAVLGVLAIAQFLLIIIQLPGRIRDTYHLPYFTEDVIAWAAGRIPLFDYIPQYTLLLGLPLKALASWLHEFPLELTLIYILILQVINILVVMMALPRVGFRGGKALQLFILVTPLAVTVANGANSGSYFAVFPLRTLLPSVLIFLFIHFARSSRNQHSWQTRDVVSLGLIAGVSTINNPDYGLASLVVVGIFLAVLVENSRQRSLAALTYAASAAVPFGFYSIGVVAAGDQVSWSDLQFFQRWHGFGGFMNESMSFFGLHTSLVGGLIAVLVIGIWMLGRGRSEANASMASRGVCLAVPSAWGIATLPYFIGTSEQSTLLGGYALVVGWVLAATLPSIINSSVQSTSIRQRWVTLSVSATALSILVATVIMNLLGPGIRPQHTRPPSLETGLDPLIIESQKLRDVVPTGDWDNLHLLIPMANEVSIATGIPSAQVVSNPMFIEIYGTLRGIQCDRINKLRPTYLLALKEDAGWIADQTSCGNYEVLKTDSHEIGKEGNLVLLRSRTWAPAANRADVAN